MIPDEICRAILHELGSTGLPDYQKLSSQEVLDIAEELLRELLQKAEVTFQEILETSDQDICFENIVERYLGQDHDVSILYGFINSLNNTDSSPKTREIVKNFQPELVRYSNKVSLNPDFYRLLKKVKESSKKLDSEQQQALELLIRDMKMAGVHLKGEKRVRLEEVNLELGRLNEEFSNNVLDTRKQFFYQIADSQCLAEMPEEDLENAREEAESREIDGWVFTLSPPSYLAILQYCSDRSIREIFWRENTKVASEGEFDNRENVLQILRLRHEKAVLLGCDNYAEYILQERMAKNPRAVTDMLDTFSDAAKEQAEKDLRELRDFSGMADITHWDLAYYSEKLRQERYEIDERELKRYFPLDKTLDGMFSIAQRLFGIKLKRIEHPLYSEGVMAFEVYEDNKLQAYFILDLFARSQKRGGAWCDKLRSRSISSDGEQPPVVINVTNFLKASKGKPVLLTHLNVETLFHEFGHALHLLLGKTRYSNLSGFETEWDFVELPSQLFENWIWEKEGVDLISGHSGTGEPLPDRLINALKKSRTFLKGLFMLRQNEFGFLDFLLHTQPVPNSIEELDRVCHQIADEYSILPKPDGYSMYTSFSHIFGGGYAAGYYSYLWAQILEADVFSRFEQEGILNPEIGKNYRDLVLAPGASKPGEILFRDFMSRNPQPEALMKKLGFAV